MNWHLIIIISGRFTTDITRLLSGHKYMCANTCMQNSPIAQACVVMHSHLFSKCSSITLREDGHQSFPHCISLALCSVALHRTLSLVSFSLLVYFISACHYSSGKNHSVQNSSFPRCKETQFLHSLLNLARVIHSTMAFTYLQGFYRQDCRQMYRLTGDSVFLHFSSTFLSSTKARFISEKNCQRVRFELQSHTESQNWVLR